MPRLYYAPYPKKTPADKVAEHLKKEAEDKVAQRRREGLRDYRNIPESFDPAPVEERPALRYKAAYSYRGMKYEEHIAYVAGEKVLVMFFLKTPVDEVSLALRDFERLVASVRAP